MRFSVVIPCHNAEPWIGAALRSVAEQTHAPHEIIVVDDTSTDASVERIHETGIDVRLLHANCGNAAAARNVGIEAAEGEWIAFQDADDLWYPHHLERAARLLGESSDVAMQAHGDVMREGEEIVPHACRWPIEEPSAGLPAQRFIEMFREHLNFIMPSVVIRRDVLVERGMFDPEFVRRHDMDMWLRVTRGHTWAFDPVAHVAYRTNTLNSVSRVNYASSEYWHLRMLLRHRAAYASPAMDWLIHRGARATMATALTEGDADDRRRGWELAQPHLNWRMRLLFRGAMCWPRGFGAVNRVRRRILQWMRSQ